MFSSVLNYKPFQNRNLSNSVPTMPNSSRGSINVIKWMNEQMNEWVMVYLSPWYKWVIHFLTVTKTFCVFFFYIVSFFCEVILFSDKIWMKLYMLWMPYLHVFAPHLGEVRQLLIFPYGQCWRLREHRYVLRRRLCSEMSIRLFRLHNNRINSFFNSAKLSFFLLSSKCIGNLLDKNHL